MPKVTVPQCQIETWAKNKTTHPGKVVKPSHRRTKVEVQQEKCYDFLSLFLFSHHCSITPFHFPFELSFISHA